MTSQSSLNLVVEVRQFSGANCYVVSPVTAPDFFTGGTDIMVHSDTRMMTGRFYSMTVPLQPDYQGVYDATDVIMMPQNR
jgi:hypothetical protein